MNWNLAVLNIAKMMYESESPEMQDFNEATMVLWWVPEGHAPTVAEAQERLEALRKHGASSYAFGFSGVFPAP